MKRFSSSKNLIIIPRLLAVVFFVIPLVWIVGAALHPPGIPLPNNIWVLPSHPSLENYYRLGEFFPLSKFILNSTWISLTGAALTLVSASFIAYIIALLSKGSQQKWIVLLLALMLLPEFALGPSRFLLYKALGWIDTPIALIAPALIGTSPFYILIYYRAFRRVPKEIFDGARIDGAGIVQTWWRVALPIGTPTTVGVGLLSFVLYWGDYTSPLLYLSSERFATLPIALQTLQQLTKSDWSLLMAGISISLLAPAGLFLVLVPYINRQGGQLKNDGKTIRNSI